MCPGSLFCWKGKILQASDILTMSSLVLAMVHHVLREHQVVLAPQTDLQGGQRLYTAQSMPDAFQSPNCNGSAFSSSSFWRTDTKKWFRPFAKSLYAFCTSHISMLFFLLLLHLYTDGSSLRRCLGCNGAIRSAKQRSNASPSLAKICRLCCNVLPFINIIWMLFPLQLQALNCWLWTLRITFIKQNSKTTVWVLCERQAQNTIRCNLVPQ